MGTGAVRQYRIALAELQDFVADYGALWLYPEVAAHVVHRRRSDVGR
jgi:hypothetical protein